MHRVSFLNSRRLTLVGHFFPSTSAAVVVMAHGFASDKPRTCRAIRRLGRDEPRASGSGHRQAADVVSEDRMTTVESLS